MARDEQLADIKARLYALPPEEFVEARNAVAKQAPGPLGRAVKALRRPTLSAWLVNLLAAHRTDELDELLTLGERLRNAQRTMQGGELRTLSARRQAVITSLVTLARDLAAERGKQIRDETSWEAETTLRAALADPEVAEQVRAGTLVKPADYSGVILPSADDLDQAVRAADADPADEPTDADAPVEVPRRAGRARFRVILGGRADEDAPAEPEGTRTKGGKDRTVARAESAERAAERAAAALAKAEAELAEATGAENDATRRLGEIAAAVDELRLRERQLRGEQAEADRDRRRSQRRRQAAEKAVADARRRLR